MLMPFWMMYSCRILNFYKRLWNAFHVQLLAWMERKLQKEKKMCCCCLMPERKAADIILISYLNSMAGIKSSHFHLLLICGIFSWIGKTKLKTDPTLWVMTLYIQKIVKNFVKLNWLDSSLISSHPPELSSLPIQFI